MATSARWTVSAAPPVAGTTRIIGTSMFAEIRVFQVNSTGASEQSYSLPNTSIAA